MAMLGGTFDPIHIGHLAIAEDVRVALQAERVLFVPAAQQPFKAGYCHSSAADRLRMVELAIANNPAFAVSDRELRRGGISYSVDTVAEIRAETPQTEIYFIVGADAAEGLPRWRNIDRLLTLCSFVIVQRPGYTLDIAQLRAELNTTPDRIIMIDGPAFDISASELRERLQTNRPARYHLPPAVWRYIQQHGLYRETPIDDAAHPVEHDRE